MITVFEVHKRFEDHMVLNGVSITFSRGMTNLIIGKSGSGKTVLLKTLVGLLTPDSGEILFDSANVLEMSPKARAALRHQTGMLFQGGALFDSMNVEQNVMFPLQMYLRISDQEARRRARECLARVALPDAGRLYPSDLSGGMRKRVAIARAIAPQPKYLFCDEPNSGLDPQTSLLIDSLIHELTREFDITTIVNTHDMNSVLAIGDRVTFLHEGRAAWSGTKEDVLASDHRELNDFVFSTPLARKSKPQESAVLPPAPECTDGE